MRNTRDSLEKIAAQSLFVAHQDITPTMSERLAGDWTRFKPGKALAGAAKGATVGGGVGTLLGHLLDKDDANFRKRLYKSPQRVGIENKVLFGTAGATAGGTIGGLADYAKRYQKNVRNTRLAGVVGVGVLGGALAHRLLRKDK